VNRPLTYPKTSNARFVPLTSVAWFSEGLVIPFDTSTRRFINRHAANGISRHDTISC
jgi:hypothetical protein